MHREVRRIESDFGAAGAVGLRRAAKVQPRLGQKIILQREALLINLVGGMAQNRAHHIGPGAGMQILAHLQGEFHVLRQGRGDMLGDAHIVAIKAPRGAGIRNRAGLAGDFHARFFPAPPRSEARRRSAMGLASG